MGFDYLEAVDGGAAALEGTEDVGERDGLLASVLSEGGGVADGAVNEGADDVADLGVDGAGDALDATAAGEALDAAVGDGGGVRLESLLDALAASGGLALSHFVLLGGLFVW